VSLNSADREVYRNQTDSGVYGSLLWRQSCISADVWR